MDLLAGRDEELAAIERQLEETRAGSARIVFLTGEPGIGKTRLLSELARRADARGCLTLSGRAAEFERELPFGVFVDALDAYLDSRGTGDLAGLSEEDLSELACVFPALSTYASGSRRPSTAAERFRTHRAVRALTERLAEDKPLVLALDDLHWADDASLELASHLLRSPPNAGVMVAAAFRAGQVDRMLEASLESATRASDAVRHLSLGPLTPIDAERLVEVGEPGERERLYRASGGNPFYLIELSRAAGDGAPVLGEHDDDRDGVPAAVVIAIVGELDGLSPSARGVAAAAAVAGDPFELDLTVPIAGIPEREALVALDELVARGLVRPSAVPRSFGFRHPLVRRAVYESCPPAARLLAHDRAAAALAAQGASPVSRAHHVERSARPGDTAAAAILREAAERTASRAPGSASRWFAGALRLLPDSSSSSERVELLTALAAARSATGDLAGSRAALLEGIDLVRGNGRGTIQLKLVVACATVEQLLGRHDGARARLLEALKAVDSSSIEAVELMLGLAAGDFYRMDYPGMRAWAARARRAAEPLGERPLDAASAAALAVAEAFTGEIAAARTHTAEAAGVVDELCDSSVAGRLDALVNVATAELYMHRYDAAASHARRGMTIARATGQGDVSPVLVPVRSAALHLSGRIADSAELLDDAVEAARLSGNAEALGWNLLSRGFTAVAAGDLELAIEVTEESVHVTRHLDDSLVATNAGLAFASALFESGEPARAIDVLLTATGGEELSLVPRAWQPNYLELMTRCWLALGRPREAEVAASRAEAVADGADLEMTAAMAQRAAAAVALARGDSRGAADCALRAAKAADAAGARVDAGVARTLAGRALAAAGESARAVIELEGAARELAACGAVRYRKQAERELRRLGRSGHRRTRPGKADGTPAEKLTEREAEIARLVVGRRTNPEIAGELFLSVKTIEAHMRNIFDKLDVSSRVELARVAERDGRLG